MSTQVEKVEKELPTISFTTNKDSKKYRDKKRKERQVKKEKGIKVNKIKKQVYNSDSEEDSEDSDSNDDSENEKPIETKKQKTTSTTTTTSATTTTTPMNRFEQDKEALSNKLSSILKSGTSTQKNQKVKKSAPILLKTEQTLNQNIIKEKERNKAEKERQLEKELLQTKDYKPIEILLTPEERDLMRLAKKGVIKLFNAVTQHQQSGLTATVNPKEKNVTKNQFLENLKNSKVKRASKNGDDEDYSDDDYSEDEKDNQQEWDVLKDDYLVKNEWDVKEEQD